MPEQLEGRKGNELNRQADVAKEQTINEAITNLPPQLADWLEQLPPYEKKQVMEALEETLDTLYDDAYHNGEYMHELKLNADSMPESIDEPIAKEGKE